MRQRGNRNRVGPTVSVTGPDTAVCAAVAASARSSTTTRGSARATGRRTGPSRSSDASAFTIVAEARLRSSRTPARAGDVTNERPRRSSEASTAGRSTAAAIRPTV